MQKKLLWKLIAIGVLSILLLIPLGMIEAQIAARSARQTEVNRNIAESAAGAQTLTVPLILVHYRERIERRSRETGSERELVSHEVVERTRLFPAQRADLDGELRVETLNRGLYRARLYHLSSRLAGAASIPPKLGLHGGNLLDARATLVIGVADTRGVEDDPEVTVNGKKHRLIPGTAGGLAGQGMHVPLGDFDPALGASYEFALPLKLTGLGQLAIAPTADSTKVRLKSDWPHPSFQGRFLPRSRTVSGEGFEASWQVSHLARSFERAVKAGEGQGSGETLDVSLMDPVNVYLKSERAVKYGSLFVILSFAGLFLTEMLRRLPLHPMQYLLVGLALAIFFLLLIALSEHIPFVLAYAISSFACVALIGTYLSGALGGRRAGMAFGAAIAALYGVLYGVLLSEDNALLMGSLLLFLALGTTMLSTRRFDWHRATPAEAVEGR